MNNNILGDKTIVLLIWLFCTETTGFLFNVIVTYLQNSPKYFTFWDRIVLHIQIITFGMLSPNLKKLTYMILGIRYAHSAICVW